MLELRPARPDELNPLVVILCDCFGLDFDIAIRLFFEDPLFDIGNKWVAVEDGKVVSTLTLVPAPMSIGSAIVPAVGICGVATPADRRRRGYATKLLRECLRNLPAMGYAAAALVPFDYDFYRPFGFEEAGIQWRASIAPRQLYRYPEQASCRWMNDGDIPVVKRIHQTHYAGRTGVIDRDERRWEFILWNNRSRVVCGNPPQGYLFYERLGRDEAKLRIREIGWTDGAGRRGIVGWLAANEEQISSIEFSGWIEDVSALITDTHSHGCATPDDPRFLVSCASGFMWRVLDILAACRALELNSDDEPITITVSDPLLPSNSRTVRLPDCEFADSDATPDIRCDIRTFSQIHIGSLDPRMAFASRRLSLSSKKNIETLARLFPMRQPSMITADQF